MPLLIEHIDAIARKKGRDVLFLDFPQKKRKGDSFPKLNVDWDNLPIRKQIITWLEQNQIEWRPCGHIADENRIMGMGYQGRIFVDVPFDIEDPFYQRLQSYLEKPNGKIRFSGVMFCYLPLEMAMKNAHHDEPGFWERWAENI